MHLSKFSAAFPLDPQGMKILIFDSVAVISRLCGFGIIEKAPFRVQKPERVRASSTKASSSLMQPLSVIKTKRLNIYLNKISVLMPFCLFLLSYVFEIISSED